MRQTKIARRNAAKTAKQCGKRGKYEINGIDRGYVTAISAIDEALLRKAGFAIDEAALRKQWEVWEKICEVAEESMRKKEKGQSKRGRGPSPRVKGK